MKKILIALAALAAMVAPAAAQVVTQLPVYLNNNVGQVYDFGNGPLELKLVQGSAQLWTMQGSGVGQTPGGQSSTTLALTTTPLTAPCVGCAVSGTGITTQTVTAFNGGTAITLSAVATVATGTALAWGAACPTSVGANAVLNTQGGIINDLPFYTTARICGASQFSTGGVVLPFAIGAH